MKMFARYFFSQHKNLMPSLPLLKYLKVHQEQYEYTQLAFTKSITDESYP